PLTAGLISSEHVVSGDPAINGRSQSGRTLKRPPEYRSGLQPVSALRLAIDRQNLTALPVDGGTEGGIA
ncbi:MAG: hypothetical protein RBT80_27365, partial [Candidatus Vecturithrix sp.]|nr:hypothetical protein [Candidatus Vecturithrix sp.]